MFSSVTSYIVYLHRYCDDDEGDYNDNDDDDFFDKDKTMLNNVNANMMMMVQSRRKLEEGTGE